MSEVFSLNTLLSLMAVTFVMLHEKIYQKLNFSRDDKKE
jgi:hypothetical protein